MRVRCELNILRRIVDIMADEEVIGDIDDEKPAEDQTVKKAAKHDSVRATDLEKVTDYVEEAEISSNNISDVRNYACVVLLSEDYICRENHNRLFIFRDFSRKHFFYFWIYAVKIDARKRIY